jgi:hypothetical protein
LRQQPDFAGELVAPPGHSADQSRLRTQRRAQRRNLHLQDILLDDPVRPHASHQRLLADHGATRLDQRQQYVMRAPAKPDWLTVGKQFTAIWQ